MSNQPPPRSRRPGNGRSQRRGSGGYDDRKPANSTSSSAIVLIVGGVIAVVGVMICTGVVLYSLAGKFTDPGGAVNPELEKARMQEALRSGQ